MELIKSNDKKKRYVYRLSDRYRKVWLDKPNNWTKEHFELVSQFVPDFMIEYGDNYIDFNVIEGVPLSSIQEFDFDMMDRVYCYILENIEQTKPYVHADWVLSNIILKPDNTLQLIDYDNFREIPKDIYMYKLHRDLLKDFGLKFLDVLDKYHLNPYLNKY